MSDRRNITGIDGRFELPDPPTGRVTVHVFPEDLSKRPPDLTEAHLTLEISAGQGRKDVGDVLIPTRRRIGGAPRGDWGFDVKSSRHGDTSCKERPVAGHPRCPERAIFAENVLWSRSLVDRLGTMMNAPTP